MRRFKFTLFSIAMAFMVFVSCTNNEPVFEEQQTTEESEAIVTSLNQMKSLFNDDGNLNNDENPAGNVVFDFCFDFVYPLDLSFNNGTTVTVADLDGLINIIFSSTENLFITGIAFPFNVETYNEDTNAIEIVTINNEEAFISLLESCSFNDFEECNCTEEYAPVCVQITGPNGETFTITYDNACYAACDGFTENDFAEDCEDDYYSGNTECFALNFPLSIIINDDTTVVINSEEELGTTLYDVYDFDFVYPFTVTLENDDVVTVNSSDDIENLLEDCYGEFNGNECEECENAAVDPVCIQYTSPEGETIVTVFPNMCYAECEGFTENNVVDCENNNPSDCSEQEVFDYLLECQWYMTTSLYNTVNAEYVEFSQDGSLEIFGENSTEGITGTWGFLPPPTQVDVFIFFNVADSPSELFSQLDWTVTQCSEDYIVLESGNEFIILERDCD